MRSSSEDSTNEEIYDNVRLDYWNLYSYSCSHSGHTDHRPFGEASCRQSIITVHFGNWGRAAEWKNRSSASVFVGCRRTFKPTGSFAGKYRVSVAISTQQLLTFSLQYTKSIDYNDEEESFLSSLKQILSIQISKKYQLLSNIGAFMTLILFQKKKKAQTICLMKSRTLYKKTYQHQHFWKSWRRRSLGPTIVQPHQWMRSRRWCSKGNYFPNGLLVYIHASLTFKNLVVKTP